MQFKRTDLKQNFVTMILQYVLAQKEKDYG